MKTKQFITHYKGKDGIVGRPIRLNYCELEKTPKKDYAELLFLGDIHLGHPQCQTEKLKAQINWAVKNRCHVIGMGDMIESGLRDSIGDSVYQQKLNPEEQMEMAIELFKPLAKEGLLIGIHEGNHEHRITKSTGIDITKIISKMLDVPYLGYSCWNWIRVDDINYSLYSTHGSSGSKYKHTKLKAIMDIAAWIDADIIAMGHVHSIAAEPIIKQSVDFRNKVVQEKECYVCLTGSYLAWDKSYAQMHNYPITKIGSPKAKIRGDRRDIHFSL